MSASIKAGLNNDMHLMTDGVTRAYVDGNGKVGIGTSSPNAEEFSVTPNGVLEVQGTKPVVYLSETDTTDAHGWLGVSNGVTYLGSTGSGLRIRTGTDSATDNRFLVDTSGNVTTPYQPAFIVEGTDEWSYGATHASTQADISYHSPWPIKSNATLTHNVGSHAVLNTHPESSGFKYLKFTAPVSGFYEFGFQANFKIMNDGDYHAMGIKVNTTGTGGSGNPDYYFFQAQRSGISDQNQFSGNGTCLVYLNVNDYAVCYSRSPEYIVVAANRWHLYGRLVG
jgi:hypothetical protein